MVYASEIRRQLVKVPMHGSCYQSIPDLTPPTQPMDTCEQARPQHQGLHPLLFSNSDMGFLTSSTNLVGGDVGDKAMNGSTSPPNDNVDHLN